jgi:two-component sensor histidine kinase
MLSNFTDFSEYMPHGMCLLWEPWLVILWAGSDLLIVAAYFAIPFALVKVLVRRDDIKQRGLVLLFASFILLCGITHALSVVTLWVPIYPFVGMVKLATGIVSATTAVVLFKLVPTIVSLPSLNDMKEANQQLREEVAAHKETLDSLHQAKDNLELIVAERTAELKEVNAKLSITAREAMHRSHNLIAVVTSMARQSSRTQTDVAEFTKILTGRLSALADATGAIRERHERSSADLKDVVTKQLVPVIETYPDKVHVDGPEVDINAEAAQQISLAIHELATNAQKYGALAWDEARISVTYSVQPGKDQGEQRLVLVWQEESGKAIPLSESKNNKEQFGTRLLLQIIPTMLNGEATRTFVDGRMKYQLSVPLSAILPDLARMRSESFVASVLDDNFGKA